ncbi:DUF6119 family protein [Candidatus Berkiella aquae]|uniref:TIGR04141 family sporadically distributed protein n=2 Tax=Candidatus Berkiella aquae TaxID=295108 RepID=A0AAE3HXQ1_9GAMM|nr:DUF6119 family protein [Candidatus Berkiella aquae]MCS5712379.1 TIGR04141 family sporadically distributed protein [Candidatus Berkiella aquae]
MKTTILTLLTSNMLELKKITIYKIKDGIDFNKFLKQFPNGYDLVTKVNNSKIYVKFENHKSDLKTNKDIPWISFLNSGFDSDQYLYSAMNSYPRAIVGIKIRIDADKHIYFAMTFGQHGDMFLDKNHIVHDFGIKVAMNICDHDKLRKVQTSIYESVTHQTERQLSIASGLSTFGINETEFLRMISGNVNDEFSDVIDSFKGKDSIALKLPESLTWNKLIDICNRFEERYKSADYKKTDFKSYDLFRHESDPQIINTLDSLLCSKIADKSFDKIHLAPPEFVGNEDLSYCYNRDTEKENNFYDDLRIDDLVSHHKISKESFSISSIKRWDIYGYNHEHQRKYKLWNGYQCLIAEIELDDKTYILANSQWREVSQDLKTIVSEYLENKDIVKEIEYLPIDVNIFDATKRQNREEIYNAHVAENVKDVFLFDKSKISIAGEKKYEICDLLNKNKHIIHVKRYSHGAASISHLFIQGRFYSYAFSTNATCRQEMRAWIDNNSHSAKDIFKSIIPEHNNDINESEYTIVFCVLHDSEKFDISDLPFMTQYELMNSHKYLTQDRKFKSCITFKRVKLGSIEN